MKKKLFLTKQNPNLLKNIKNLTFIYNNAV